MEAAVGQHAIAQVRWLYASVHYFVSKGIAKQQEELTCCTQVVPYRGENEN